MIFLTAILPNTGEFVEWVAPLHAQQCHVIGTDFWPTLLQQYGDPVQGDGLYHLKDADGEFLSGRFEGMVTQLQSTKRGEITRSKRVEELLDGTWKKQALPGESRCSREDKEEGKHLLELIQVCEQIDFLPYVPFCFKG